MVFNECLFMNAVTPLLYYYLNYYCRCQMMPFKRLKFMSILFLFFLNKTITNYFNALCLCLLILKLTSKINVNQNFKMCRSIPEGILLCCRIFFSGINETLFYHIRSRSCALYLVFYILKDVMLINYIKYKNIYK